MNASYGIEGIQDPNIVGVEVDMVKIILQKLRLISSREVERNGHIDGWDLGGCQLYTTTIVLGIPVRICVNSRRNDETEQR